MKRILILLTLASLACSTSPVFSSGRSISEPTVVIQPTTVWQTITITSNTVNLRDHTGVSRETATLGQVFSALCGPDLCYLAGGELTVFIGCTSEANGRKCLEK